MSVSRLGFEVDSSQAKSAAIDLDRLTTSASKAEKAERGTAAASRQLEAALSSMHRILSSIDQNTASTASGVERLSAEAKKAAQSTEKIVQSFGDADLVMRRFIDRQTGVTRASQQWQGPLADLNAELDRLRAKFNPLFAASQAYERELNDLNRAHQIGAITAQEQAAALDSLNSRYQAAAVAANAASTATQGAAMSAGMLRMQSRQLAFQLIDMGQAIPLAFQSPIYALQNFGFQFAQIGQLYMGQGGMRAALTDSISMVGRLVARLGPVALVAGAATAALAGMTHEINQVSDVTVGMGDVALATFQVIRDGIFEMIRPAVDAIAPWFGSAWDWVADKTIWLGNLIINSFHAAFVDINSVVDSIAAVFAGGYEAVVATWSGLPAALGDFVYSTANRVVQGVEDLINGTITRLNKLISMLPDWVGIGGFDQIEFGGIDNPYAGAASALRGQLAEIGGRTSSVLGDIWANRNAAVADIMGGDPLGGFLDAVRVRAVQNALEGVKDEAGAVGKALKGAADQAKDPWNGLTKELERMQNALQDAGRGTGSILKGLIDGTLSWKDALSQALSVAVKLMMQFNPGLFGGGFAQGVFGGLLGFSHGGVITQGNVVPFADGGVVNRSTVFPMANGVGLMGEAGPEAIMPLKRGPDGRLGVSAPKGASAPSQNTYAPTYNIDASNSANPEETRRQVTQALKEYDKGNYQRWLSAQAQARKRNAA